MRISRLAALSTAFITAVALSAAPANAAGPNAKAPKTNGKPTTTGPAVKSTGPATKGAGAAKTTKAPKSTNASKAPKTKSATTAAGKGKKTTTTTVASTSTTTTSTDNTTTTGTTPTTTEWTPTNAVSQKLASKSKLMQKAQAAVGAGVDLNYATAGFKNFGQFMAAVNAVTNHPDIKFADLHTLMTGYNMEGTQTTQTTYSLGQSLQQLKPGIDADAAASTATTQATKDAGQ
jgi:hypothetical protein